MIGYGICIGSQPKYEGCALPGLRRHADPTALIAESSDNTSILTAYNEILDAFAQHEDLEALVLLHEDLELLDPEFEAKVRAALTDPDVAVLGVVGADEVPGLEWWLGKGAGHVKETRGAVDFGRPDGKVQAVDGMLLVLSPWAVRNLRFDASTFSGFHAYDLDFCFQASAAGKTVGLVQTEVFHHTKGGFGDEVGFRLADAAFRDKWGLAARETLFPVDCPTCDQPLVAGPRQQGYEIALCESCGVGATLPVPSRDIASDDIWTEQYGGGRIRLRDQWLKEAELRVSWLQLYVPDGTLLEVGGGTGEFTVVAAQHGYDAYGVEPSAWAAQIGRDLGGRITTGDLTTWRREHFSLQADAVVAFHVFEHIHDPRDFLAEITKVLTPNGVIAFEVPNFDSVLARRRTLEWASNHLADHVYHYTSSSLRQILEQEGFEVLSTLEFTTRIYDAPAVWQQQRAMWRDSGLFEAPKDMLRVVARHRPDTD